MKRLIALLLPAALLLATPAAAAARKPAPLAGDRLRAEMRELWEDHVTYTAAFYTAVIYGGDDAAKIAERLLRNQDDIGNAMKPFYGEKAGHEISALLRDHILIAADLVKAAKAGDAAAQERATKKWYSNADDIAAFLSSVNPNWPRKALEDMLHGHLAMTIDAVTAKLHHDTAAAIAAYDRGVQHMLMVADALSSGIEKQFPDRFRS